MGERVKGLVSVVVTNYNNENYIEQCLESLINQSYKNIEIIIVDDSSTDKSLLIIEEWIKKLSIENKKKVILLKNIKNIGFSGAVTLGLYVAKGEYIAMQDGDDISYIQRIEKQIKFLNENENINMVGSNYSVFTDNILDARQLPNFVVFGKENIENDFANGKSPVSFGTILFKGRIFDEIGGLTRKLNGAEDYEFIAKSIYFGIDNINESLYYYRRHEKQRSREFYEKTQAKKKSMTKNSLSILLVIDSFNIGGTETHVLSLAKELIDDGIKVTIVAGDGPLGSEFHKLNCKIYNINFPAVIPSDKGIFSNFKIELSRIIKTEEVNLIHVHQSSSGSIALELAKEEDIPCIFTIHGMYYYDILGRYLKKADKVISVSYPVYEWLNKFGINSIVVPNGIGYENYSSYDRKFIRQKNSVPNDSLIVTYCSRMDWGKVKVCENLINVVRDLNRSEGMNYYAVIVGHGAGYGELKVIGDKANNIVGKEIIKFEGNQINVPQYYVGSDCIVGTGRVAIEGMAARRKIIASGNNGYFGLVNIDNFTKAWSTYFGDHGSRYNNNAMYLYDDMRKYYNNKDYYDKDIDIIYNKSKSLFDIEIVTDRIINIYLDSFK